MLKHLSKNFTKFWNKSLKEKDPLLYNIIQKEIKRQQESVLLIASENLTSNSVLEALGSPL